MTRGKQDNASPVAATHPGKIQRRRKPRRVQPKIDRNFADPVDISDTDPDAMRKLEDGDLEELGDVGGFATVEFTKQYYERNLPCSEDEIRSFAAEFGIENIAALRYILTFIAMTIDDVDLESSWIIEWKDENWLAPETYAAAYKHAVEHVDALLKLLSGPFWPVALDDEPERVRKALIKYRRWLAEFRFARKPRPKGQPPLTKEQTAAHVLALAWPVLTAEEPFVVQTQNDEKRPGKERERPLSRFNTAFLRICRLFGLRHQISSKALAGWLAKTAAQRAAHHAELNRRAGTD